MSETLIDISTYPISAATQKQLSRPLFGHVIEGEVVPSLDGATMPIIDPATGGSGRDGRGRLGRRRRARRQVGPRRRSTTAAGASWRRSRRSGACAGSRLLLAERGDVFGELDVIDAGLLRLYAGFIVQFAVDGIEYYAGWPTKIAGTIPAVPTEFAVYQMREPIGVVGLIMPWNGPTAVFAFVAAAISAGNSVVLKPAEQTPMTAVLMAELAIEAGIPPGVFNVVQGVGRGRRARRSSPPPRSTPSRSPAPSRPGARSRPPRRRG